MAHHNAQSDWTARELAQRWNCHRSSAVRIMFRHGFSGLKFSDKKQGARRFPDTEVKKVEELFRRNVATARSNAGNGADAGSNSTEATK